MSGPPQHEGNAGDELLVTVARSLLHEYAATVRQRHINH